MAAKGLLGLLVAPTLREDLDHHNIGGALKAKPCVLGDNLTMRMLGEYVKAVPLGDPIFNYDGAMDGLADLLQSPRLRPAFMSIRISGT